MKSNVSLRRTVALLLVVLVVNRCLNPLTSPGAGVYGPDSTRVTVERVVDGDTLMLDDGTRVRLIGVDAPELGHGRGPDDPFAADARQRLQKLIADSGVRLEFDRERRDSWFRILAYVYCDDVLVNEEIIRSGYARALTRFPFRSSMKRRFRRAEEEARDAGRGMWEHRTAGQP